MMRCPFHLSLREFEVCSRKVGFVYCKVLRCEKCVRVNDLREMFQPLKSSRNSQCESTLAGLKITSYESLKNGLKVNLCLKPLCKCASGMLIVAVGAGCVRAGGYIRKLVVCNAWRWTQENIMGNRQSYLSEEEIQNYLVCICKIFTTCILFIKTLHIQSI